MPEEKTDQPASRESEGLKSVWESDFFVHGLENFDEATKEPVKSDADCPECVKERQAKEAAEAAKKAPPPYKVLKVGGKEIPVSSEEELIALAQKGMDYTQKTQSVAEERKKIDSEKSDFTKAMDRFNDLYERLAKGNIQQEERAPGQPPTGEMPPPEKSIEEEYGIDKDLADPWTLKMANDLRAVREKNERLEQTTQLFLMDKVVGVMRDAISDSVKEFPVTDVTDPNSGKSLTQQQFVAILKSKLESPENRGKPLPAIAREAVQELHMSQRVASEAATEKVKGELISDDMSPEEFKAKHPKLFGKLTDQGVAEYLANKGGVPPTLKSRGAEVEPSQTKVRTGERLSDAIDRAFEDKDFLKNTFGG